MDNVNSKYPEFLGDNKDLIKRRFGSMIEVGVKTLDMFTGIMDTNTNILMDYETGQSDLKDKMLLIIGRSEGIFVDTGYEVKILFTDQHHEKIFGEYFIATFTEDRMNRSTFLDDILNRAYDTFIQARTRFAELAKGTKYIPYSGKKVARGSSNFIDENIEEEEILFSTIIEFDDGATVCAGHLTFYMNGKFKYEKNEVLYNNENIEFTAERMLNKRLESLFVDQEIIVTDDNIKDSIKNWVSKDEKLIVSSVHSNNNGLMIDNYPYLINFDSIEYAEKRKSVEEIP